MTPMLAMVGEEVDQSPAIRHQAAALALAIERAPCSSWRRSGLGS